jgi:hypothetical protein
MTTQKIILTAPILANGKVQPKGTALEVDKPLALKLIATNRAKTSPAEPVAETSPKLPVEEKKGERELG